MSAPATVLRTVAWRDDTVRVGSPPRAVAPVAPVVRDPVSLGYDEGLRRGLAEGRSLGREEGAREGHADGLERGLADARAQAQEELRAMREQLRSQAAGDRSRMEAAALAMERALPSVVAAAEDDLVVLCLEVLGRLVGSTLTSPDGVRAQALQLLAGQERAAPVAVHLHPTDAALLERSDAPGARGWPGLRWVADERVALGGCEVRGAAQSVDARLEVVLESLKTALLEGRRFHDDRDWRLNEAVAP